MVRQRILGLSLITALGLGCGKLGVKKPANVDPVTMKSLVEKRDYYVKEADLSKVFTERCDALTFKSLWDAYGAKLDVFKMERPVVSGKWHRDETDCYPKDSRSEISRDGIIMLLHSLWMRGNKDAVDRMVNYLAANDMIMGEGPDEYVNMTPLFNVMKHMQAKMSKSKVVLGPLDDLFLNLTKDMANDYRGHLLAMYFYLNMRVDEDLSKPYVVALKSLAENNDRSSIYHCLRERFSKDTPERCLSLLGDENRYPKTSIPYEVDASGWQGLKAVLGYIVSVSILEM
jgi:hypothetical protein